MAKPLAILAALALGLAWSPGAGAHEPFKKGPPPTDPLTLAPKAGKRSLGPGSWPLYGHDLANSRSAPRGGPAPAQARRLGPVWSFKSTVGDFTGTPSVASGVVVAGAGGGTVFALDAVTGRLRWERDVHEYISGTVAIHRGRVYVALSPVGRPTVAALRLSDGALLWETVVDTQPGADLYGSPIAADGTVYIGVSGGWGEEIGARTRGAVVALDARSGRTRWHTYTVPPGYDGAPVWTTPALDRRRHRLYVGTGNAYHPPAFETTDAILVLDSRTGRIVRRYQATRSDVHRGHEGADPDADFGASPNLLGPDMVGGYQKSRVYWALDRRNLRPTWSRLTAKPLSRQPPEAIASTAFDGQRIYGQTDYGQVFALDLRGRRLWITRGDGRQNYSPIAVANGVVYNVHARGRLQARSAQSGRLLAQLPLGGPTWGGVSVVGGSVFVSTGTQFDTGFVVAYRPRRS